MRPYITYGRHRSDEFGIITEIKRQKGTKKRVTASVPFSSFSPDFSLAAGKYAYNERTDTYTIVLKADTEQKLEDLVSEVSSWLLGTPIGDLRDSSFTGRHMIYAICISADVSYVNSRCVKLSAVFKSYPFLIADNTRPSYYSLTPNFSYASYELTFADSALPYITAPEGAVIRYHGTDYAIPVNSKRYRISEILFVRGVNEFQVKGSGELTIETFEELI